MLGAEQNPKDVTLPPSEERDWLMGQMAKLLERSRHVASYLRAPLLTPTGDYFPDRWGGGEASVRRLLLRLLRYAGHEGIEVTVVIHDQDPARRGEVVGKPAPMRGKDPVAWFVGRGDDGLHFACEEIIMPEPENLVPALARAVAHAHRVILGLPQPDSQRLIDLSGIVLGFGLLTTDASQRFYAKSAGGFKSTRAEFRLGALSVQDMSFLLAMQLEARSCDRRTRRKLLAHLQPNQGGFVREAQAWLTKLQPSLRARLGLAEPAHWPPPADLDHLTGPLVDPRKVGARAAIVGSGVFDAVPEGERGEGADEDEDEDEIEGDEDEDEDDEPRRDVDPGTRGSNRGKPVFRIERSAALRMAKLLGLPVVLMGALVSRGNFGVEVPMDKVVVVAVCLAVVGLGIGSFFTDRRCSEPKCGVKLSLDDEVCPFCAGVVMEVIHHPKERLGAEEELARAGKVSAEGLVVGWSDKDEGEDEDGEDDDESEAGSEPNHSASAPLA